jgi:hypothetical protein
MDPRLRRVSGPEAIGTDGEQPPREDALLAEAAALGFELVSYQTQTDQIVWEWRQGEGPRPQFVTERVARQWMTEWLARQPEVVQPQPLDGRRRVRDGDGDSDGGAVRHVAETA